MEKDSQMTGRWSITLVIALAATACTDPEAQSSEGRKVTDTIDSRGVQPTIDVPVEPASDNSYLLHIPPPDNPPTIASDDRTVLPGNELEWVVVVEYDPGEVPMQRVYELFSPAWADGMGWPALYVYDPETAFWSLPDDVRARKVTKLCFSWKLVQEVNGIRIVFKEADLQGLLDGLKAYSEKLGPVTVTVQTPIPEAGVRAMELADIVSTYEQNVVMVLQSNRDVLFPRDSVWEVLLSAGLLWEGKDGLFHAPNDRFGWGDADFFSVGTTTEPGYFDPGTSTNQSLGIDNLIFGYSIPRSANPSGVYDAMLRVITFAQNRLGGELTNISLQPIDTLALRKEVVMIEKGLKDAELPPGKPGTTMYLFAPSK